MPGSLLSASASATASDGDAPAFSLLMIGDRGPAVLAWQERLDTWRARQGIPGIARDGIFGPITRGATKQFQHATHIVVDGIVGPQTEGAMSAALAAQVSRCAFDDLTITSAPLPGAAGHTGDVLRFTNDATHVCSLYGYPGVAGLNDSGTQITQAVRVPRGYMGGLPPGEDTPPDVVLQPGQTASARVEGTDVPTASQPCPLVSGMLVTPPNATHSARVSAVAGDCAGLLVTPVVAGASGGTP